MRARLSLLGTTSTALLLVGAAAWLAFLRPGSLGGPATYVMVSGVSMQPTLQNGDFIIARRQAGYEIGDIVVYAVPKGDVGEGSLIIHRIIGREPEGFVIQGDNPDIKVPDVWRPGPDEIEGKLWVAIPAVGRYLPLLRSPLILALLAGLFVFWVMYPNKEEEKEPKEPPEPGPAEPPEPGPTQPPEPGPPDTQPESSEPEQEPTPSPASAHGAGPDIAAPATAHAPGPATIGPAKPFPGGSIRAPGTMRPEAGQAGRPAAAAAAAAGSGPDRRKVVGAGLLVALVAILLLRRRGAR